MMRVVRRLLWMIPVLLVTSLATFMLAKSAPGSPFDRERAAASPEIERVLMAKYHVNDGIWVGYLRYLGLLWEKTPEGEWRRVPGGLITGDFGPSTRYRNHTINDIISQGLPVSMTLGILGFLFAQGIGIPLGFYTAARRGQWPDYAGSVAALVMI